MQDLEKRGGLRLARRSRAYKGRCDGVQGQSRKIFCALLYKRGAAKLTFCRVSVVHTCICVLNCDCCVQTSAMQPLFL